MKTTIFFFSVALSLSSFAFVAQASDSKMPEAPAQKVRPLNQGVESPEQDFPERYDDSRSASLSHIPDDVNCAGYLGEDDASGYDVL